MNRGPGLIIGLLLVFVLAVTAACGGDDDNGDNGDDPTATTAAAADPTSTTAEEEGDDEEEGNGDDADIEAGQTLASQQCFACHTVDGTQAVGPSWQGLYGSEVELEDGSTVTADEAYIEESIREPNAKVHAGFPASVMPSYGDTFSDEQIQQLVAYIRSLE